MSEFVLPILIIAILIGINGIFVAAEFAIVVAPYSRIARWAEEGKVGAARILPWLKNPLKRNRYIGTAQIGITLASLGLGMYGERTFVHWLESPLEHYFDLDAGPAHTIALIGGVSILTYLHVVFGEMIAKSIAIQSADTSLLRLSGFMTVAQKAFNPFVVLLNKVADAITRIIGIPSGGVHDQLFSAEELEFIVEESALRGLLNATERVYVGNIFDLNERTAGQVMTPRNRVAGISFSATLEEGLKTVCNQPFSRFPVFGDDREGVVGVLHIKSLARRVANEPQPFSVSDLMRDPVLVPEGAKVSAVLRTLRQRHEHLAVVIDEFGGFAGLVTLEDIIEEVVGEIQDEFDIEIAPIRRISDSVIEVRGDLLIAELNQHFGLEFGEEQSDTIGGLIMDRLGRVPQEQDELTVGDLYIRVMAMDGHAVGQARIKLPS